MISIPLGGDIEANFDNGKEIHPHIISFDVTYTISGTNRDSVCRMSQSSIFSPHIFGFVISNLRDFEF